MSDTELTTVILVCGIIGAATFVLGSGENATENVWRKVKLLGAGVLHMLLSKDKKFVPGVSAFMFFEGLREQLKHLLLVIYLHCPYISTSSSSLGEQCRTCGTLAGALWAHLYHHKVVH